MTIRTGAWIISLAFAIGLCASFAEAQSKASVSGTWKMNPQKSKFEKGGPDAITIKFDQDGTKLTEILTLSGQQGERSLNLNYTTDGKESVNQVMEEDAKCTAKWDGASLVLEWKVRDLSFARKLTLSEDGKSMTMAVRQSGPQGETNDTVVLEKQ